MTGVPSKRRLGNNRIWARKGPIGRRIPCRKNTSAFANKQAWQSLLKRKDCSRLQTLNKIVASLSQVSFPLLLVYLLSPAMRINSKQPYQPHINVVFWFKQVSLKYRDKLPTKSKPILNLFPHDVGILCISSKPIFSDILSVISVTSFFFPVT